MSEHLLVPLSLFFSSLFFFEGWSKIFELPHFSFLLYLFFSKKFLLIISEGWSKNIWAASFSFLFYLFFIFSFFFTIVSEGWSNTPTTWKPWLKREPTATWKRKRGNCPISFLIIFTMIWLYDDNYSLSRCEDLLHELLPSSVARFNVILFSNLSDRFQKGLSFFNFFSSWK